MAAPWRQGSDRACPLLSPVLVLAEQGSGEAPHCPSEGHHRLVFCVLTSNSTTPPLSLEQPWGVSITGNPNRFRKCAVVSLPENRRVGVRTEGPTGGGITMAQMEECRACIQKRVLVASPISILSFLTNRTPIFLGKVTPAFLTDRRNSCYGGIPGQFFRKRTDSVFPPFCLELGCDGWSWAGYIVTMKRP